MQNFQVHIFSDNNFRKECEINYHIFENIKKHYFFTHGKRFVGFDSRDKHSVTLDKFTEKKITI